VLSSGGLLGPGVEDDLLTMVNEENARIRLLNASYQSDLGEMTASWMREQGFNVVEVGFAQATTVSTIDLMGATPYALRWLVETFGMTPGHIDHRFSSESTVDIELILGDDWANNNPMQ
jgi:hypothetical protein